VRQYETAFLIAPNLPEEDNEKLIDQMADIVSSKKGKMLNVDKWGKRRMAYQIQRFQEAFYVFFLYEGEPAVPFELERRFKQTEAILRYLTVKYEGKKPVKEKRRPAPKVKRKEVKAKKTVSVEEPPDQAEKVPAAEEKEEEN
jgi:small subunit ribosomal protein S6